MKNSIFALLSFFFALTALAAEPLQISIEKPVTKGNYSVGVGSKVGLRFPDQASTHDGLFLGRVVQGDGSVFSYILFDEETSTVVYAAATSVAIPANGLENIFKHYDQKGGTCTAYGLFDYLAQLHLSGFVGNGALGKTLSTEQGRTQLLMDMVNQYYLEPQHKYSIVGILNGYGKTDGFKCKKKIFDDVDSIRSFALSQLGKGAPFVVSFNVGPNMFEAPFPLKDFDHPEEPIDNRLWIPRQVGQRNEGGHTVTAVAAFEARGKLELLMLDSDWDAPRLWDFDSIFTDRTALAEVEFDSCE